MVQRSKFENATSFVSRPRVLPLPEGEGRGEGEGVSELGTHSTRTDSAHFHMRGRGLRRLRISEPAGDRIGEGAGDLELARMKTRAPIVRAE
jgi:hypothetical protein